MATATEMYNSQSASTGTSNATVELLYFVTDAADKDEAITAIQAEAAATQTIDGETIPLQDIDANPQGSDCWVGTVLYSRIAPDQGRNKETGESYYNFEVSTESQHITHSLSTPSTLGTAPDQGGAINVSGAGPTMKIDGTNVLFPTHVFSETHYLSDATVDTAYKIAIAALASKKNNATFRGFAAGEVLFLGASGTKRGSGNWEITFRFGVRQNEAAFAVTGIGGTTTKRGWDYAWVLAQQEKSGSGKMAYQNKGAYIEEIYADGDFSTLGI